MSTIKIKSTELVRKFAEIKAVILETKSRAIVEEYNRPVLVIYPSDENGEPLSLENPKSITELETLRRKLRARKIKVSSVNFV